MNSETPMKVVAFVPIRLNSQRVEGKNLRQLGGKPLMCHILGTLLGVEAIDEVYVYCSDEAVRAYLPEGVRFLRRSPHLDRNETLGGEIYDAFTAAVDADVYVLAHATSPFIRAATIAAALRKVTDAEKGGVMTRPSAPSGSRPSPGTRAGRSTMRSTPFRARRRSNRSTSRRAPSSSSGAKCGATCTSVSADAPTPPLWIASRGSTSTTPRISRWPSSSPGR